MEQKLYTVKEIAAMLRVDTTTVRRWIASGALKAIVLPGKGIYNSYRVKEKDLLQAIEK